MVVGRPKTDGPGRAPLEKRRAVLLRKLAASAEETDGPHSFRFASPYPREGPLALRSLDCRPMGIPHPGRRRCRVKIEGRCPREFVFGTNRCEIWEVEFRRARGAADNDGAGARAPGGSARGGGAPARSERLRVRRRCGSRVPVERVRSKSHPHLPHRARGTIHRLLRRPRAQVRRVSGVAAVRHETPRHLEQVQTRKSGRGTSPVRGGETRRHRRHGRRDAAAPGESSRDRPPRWTTSNTAAGCARCSLRGRTISPSTCTTCARGTRTSRDARATRRPSPT